jgi:hypothetical protein
MTCRLDKLMATKIGNIESIRCASNLVNGNVCTLGALVTGEREIFNAITSTDLTVSEFLLVATPEYDPMSRTNNVEDFVLTAGVTGRGYHLQAGDIFTVTQDLIDGTPAIGGFVVPQEGSFRLAYSATGTALDEAGGTVIPRFQGRIVEQDVLGTNPVPAWVIQVVNS